MKWLYRCPSCGAEYAIEPGRYLCEPCSAANKPGGALHGVLECIFDCGLKERQSFGRRLDSGCAAPLPVEDEHFPPIPVGDTPLWQAPRLRTRLGFDNLWLKDDCCEPSGSYKDRASFLVAAFARKHGIAEVVLASTGNAASSMACVGAAAGLKVTVFLPKSAPVAKRVQVLQYGAELREIEGSYDLAFDESLAYSRARGLLSRNTAYNPLTIEGKKTAAFEILRDLCLAEAEAEPPDHVFVPSGDGVIIAGVIKGFEDLMKLGLTERMPRVWAVQAEGSSAIARALSGSGTIEPRPSRTIADSIAVDAPRGGIFALAKLKKHCGGAVVVSDEQILEAQRLASSCAGLFAEPSSACALAGFMKVRAEIKKTERVVVMLTGSGLKDIRSAAKAVGCDL